MVLVINPPCDEVVSPGRHKHNLLPGFEVVPVVIPGISCEGDILLPVSVAFVECDGFPFLSGGGNEQVDSGRFFVEHVTHVFFRDSMVQQNESARLAEKSLEQQCAPGGDESDVG